MSRDYYVYLHRTADTGEVFYVGKGTKDRMMDTEGRSEEWKAIVKDRGFVPEILLTNLTSKEAEYKERELIINTPEDYKLVNTSWSKARVNSSTGIIGVCYEEKSRKRRRKKSKQFATEVTRQITAHIYDSLNKCQLRKSWSLKSLSYEDALEFAKEWRKSKEKELLEQQSKAEYLTFQYKANKDENGNILLYDNDDNYLETIVVQPK